MGSNNCSGVMIGGGGGAFTAPLCSGALTPSTGLVESCVPPGIGLTPSGIGFSDEEGPAFLIGVQSTIVVFDWFET